MARDVGGTNAIGGVCPHGRADCSTGLSFRRRRGGRTSTHRTGNLRHAFRCSAGRQSSGSQIGGSPRMRRDTSSATDDREVWQAFASLEHAGELPRTSHREDEGREDGGPGTRGGRAVARTPHADSLRCFTGALYGIARGSYGRWLSRNAKVEHGSSHSGWGARGGSGKYSPADAARPRDWTSGSRLAREKHDPGPRIVQPSFSVLREAVLSDHEHLLFLHDRPQRIRLAPGQEIFTPGPIPWRAGPIA